MLFVTKETPNVWLCLDFLLSFFLIFIGIMGGGRGGSKEGRRKGESIKTDAPDFSSLLPHRKPLNCIKLHEIRYRFTSE